jgi:hypothetical protein
VEVKKQNTEVATEDQGDEEAKTTAAAATDRAVVDSIEWAAGDRQDGDRQEGESEEKSRAIRRQRRGGSRISDVETGSSEQTAAPLLP